MRLNDFSEAFSLLRWLKSKDVRLNDVSEAFSLLRWLKSKDVRLSAADLIGQRPQIATPDQVVIGRGPKVRAQNGADLGGEFAVSAENITAG
jgi:hypothetical protein